MLRITVGFRRSDERTEQTSSEGATMTSTAVTDFVISAVLLTWGGLRVRAHLRLPGGKDARDRHEFIQQRGNR